MTTTSETTTKIPAVDWDQWDREQADRLWAAAERAHNEGDHAYGYELERAATVARYGPEAV